MNHALTKERFVTRSGNFASFLVNGLRLENDESFRLIFKTLISHDSEVERQSPSEQNDRDDVGLLVYQTEFPIKSGPFSKSRC